MSFESKSSPKHLTSPRFSGPICSDPTDALGLRRKAGGKRRVRYVDFERNGYGLLGSLARASWLVNAGTLPPQPGDDTARYLVILSDSRRRTRPTVRYVTSVFRGNGRLDHEDALEMGGF